MRQFKSVLIAAFVAIIIYSDVAELVKVKFTNIICEEFDKPFATFRTCRLKALARDTVSLHVHVELHQVPIDNMTINAQFFQKGNGYRPFMYNDTADLCEFFKRPSRFMFWKIFYDMFRPSSNVNHTCPYDHDIIVDGFVMNFDMFKLIPLPNNDYMLQWQFAAYNHYKAKVRVYFRIYN